MQRPKLRAERFTVWILGAVCYFSLAGVIYAFLSKDLQGWIVFGSLFTALIGAPSLLGLPIYLNRKGYLTGTLRRDAYIGAIGAVAFLLVLVMAIFSSLKTA